MFWNIPGKRKVEDFDVYVSINFSKLTQDMPNISRLQRYYHCRIWLVFTFVVIIIANSCGAFVHHRGRCNTKSLLFSTILGPTDPKPDYENIHGPLGKQVDDIFLKLFRKKLAENIGIDSNLPQDDYQGIMELTQALNARYSDRNQVQKIAQNVLVSLFPSWLPPQFAILFGRPFPEFSSKMNAWATYVAGTWLMGECEINDCKVDGGKIGENQGLKVKRCRFLEESGCASVCVNSCKIPTQKFFIENMGLPLSMEPDYETFEVSE